MLSLSLGAAIASVNGRMHKMVVSYSSNVCENSLVQWNVWIQRLPRENVSTMSPVLMGHNFSSVVILLTFMLCQCNVMTLLNSLCGMGAWSDVLPSTISPVCNHAGNWNAPIHWVTSLSIPYILSLLRSQPWGTFSNALAESKTPTMTRCPRWLESAECHRNGAFWSHVSVMPWMNCYYICCICIQ